MKKIILIIVFLLSLTSSVIFSSTSELSCSDVEGMAIFGYDDRDDKWKFIGAISNEFNSESIANEFGAGNEFSSDSIMNDFGDFGSEFSSESAFNDFASNPPIIIDNNYKFVGYLTINEYKTPHINTHEAISCAKETFKSFTQDNLKNITFSDIPSSVSDSSNRLLKSILYNCMLEYGVGATVDLKTYKCKCGSGYIFNSTENKCVRKQKCLDLINGYEENNKCYCNKGYEWGIKEKKCVIISQDKKCKKSFGKNSIVAPLDDTKCICKNGYKWSKDGKSCIVDTHKKNNGDCEDGYVLKNKKCISHTQDCKNFFGEHVIGSKGVKENTSTCNCESGYKWNSTKTKCLVDNFDKSNLNNKNIVSNNNQSKLSGKRCSADLIMTQNLRAPKYGERYIKNGRYDRYTKGIVKEAHILQKHLNRLGFSAGKVDGIIGPKTRAAIMRLQKYLGTTQDGYVGPKTRALLNNSCK